jgi:protein TonB
VEAPSAVDSTPSSQPRASRPLVVEASPAAGEREVDVAAAARVRVPAQGVPAQENLGSGSGPSGSGSGAGRGSGDATGAGTLSRVARPASKIRPRYPEAARERGDEAEVVVEAWVAASGRVARARVRSSAGSEFDEAALEAVHEARFYPAWRDGEPVASRVAMRLHFELDR